MFNYIETREARKYAELSSKAKEYAKNDYLENPCRFEDFIMMLEDDLGNIFPNSELEIQCSLSSCQGDGVNIYGKLLFEDFLALADGHIPELSRYITEHFNEKELRAIKFYMNNFTDYVMLPYNNSYFYSMAFNLDFANELIDTLEYSGIKNINEELIYRFQKSVSCAIQKLNKNYENWGYEFLYEISDEEMEEISESNGWLYHPNGSIFCKDEIWYPEEFGNYNKSDDVYIRVIGNENDPKFTFNFTYAEKNFSCFIYAANEDQAYRLFYENNPHISYEMLSKEIRS